MSTEKKKKSNVFKMAPECPKRDGLCEDDDVVGGSPARLSWNKKKRIAPDFGTNGQVLRIEFFRWIVWIHWRISLSFRCRVAFVCLFFFFASRRALECVEDQRLIAFLCFFCRCPAFLFRERIDLSTRVGRAADVIINRYLSIAEFCEALLGFAGFPFVIIIIIIITIGLRLPSGFGRVYKPS